ncbi:MAG: hypothetical protein LBH45_07520 [Campylobacteraceae bacterium]|jgi:hypothetical protein|nr:hypothetical protein [Campylobacteraceae bacterium]
MKKIVKLFAVTLVCGLFLAGCVGDNSDNGDNGDDGEDNLTLLSFAFIEREFPPFAHEADEINRISTRKIYKFSEDYMANFSEVLAYEGYQNLMLTIWVSGNRPGSLQVDFNENTIYALIGSSTLGFTSAEVVQDDFFDGIFDFIAEEGNVTEVRIETNYLPDIPERFDEYAENVLRPEFDCTMRISGTWTCTKESNGMIYSWTSTYKSYARVIGYK